MHYWRDRYFNTLTEAANSAVATPAWAEYAQFCSLLEKGLRKDAFAHLESFIKAAVTWPLPEKQKFVSWLQHFAYERLDDSYLLIPHPLSVKFLKPTLIEWIRREPESGEPHRWLGSPDHLEEAIRLDPRDEIARERLANYILAGVDNALSRISCCEYYAGDAEEDLQSLERVGPLIESLSDVEIRAQYYVKVAELREGVKAYLLGKEET